MAETIILPGAVDMHVHFRDPGYTEAEDFYTGTGAALASGVVAVFDMPNNKDNPTTTLERLEDKINRANRIARTFIGFYFGADPRPDLEIGSDEYSSLVETFRIADRGSFGVKLYCDVTTGSDHKHGADDFRPVVSARLAADPKGLVLAHTEGGESTAEMIDLVAREFGGRIHIPHISKEDELDAVIEAKMDPNLSGRVTTGVCPHHLFLIAADSDRLGWFGRMKPTLGSPYDREYLRANIDMIDVVETDHAPHPAAAKETAQRQNPFAETGTGKPTCFGVPGLEAMLPLLLRGEQEGWISRDKIIDMTSTRPAKILGVELPQSEVHFSDERFEFTQEDVRSKCGWSPYVGMEMVGKIKRVVVGGETTFEDGELLAWPGGSKVLRPKHA
jgi:dihydroorotase